MIIYVERKYIDNKITQKILKSYPKAQVLLIDNYKNIFDKTLWWKVEKSFIIAWVKNAIWEAPDWYGHPGKGFFFKNSLNCIYECSYCYLRWSFKNNTNVIFVNYDEIKKQILDTVKKVRKKNEDETIWFYSSDYSDNLALDTITDFTKEFIPFFESLKNVKMEIRTKSLNIWNLLKFNGVKNTEIAFSLNPSEIIKCYEFKTSNLKERLNCINKLIQNLLKVWIRFMPLLEIKNYKEVYKEFLEEVSREINFSSIYSVFIGWLLYTKWDYNKIISEDKYLDILYTLENSEDWYMRESREVRDYFYELFDSMIIQKECNRCLDK